MMMGFIVKYEASKMKELKILAVDRAVSGIMATCDSKPVMPLIINTILRIRSKGDAQEYYDYFVENLFNRVAGTLWTIPEEVNPGEMTRQEFAEQFGINVDEELSLSWNYDTELIIERIDDNVKLVKIFANEYGDEFFPEIQDLDDLNKFFSNFVDYNVKWYAEESELSQLGEQFSEVKDFILSNLQDYCDFTDKPYGINYTGEV